MRMLRTEIMSNPAKSNEAPKVSAIDALNRLPDDATWDDILECLFLDARLAQGIEDAAAGKYYTHREVQDMITRWQVAGEWAEGVPRKGRDMTIQDLIDEKQEFRPKLL